MGVCLLREWTNTPDFLLCWKNKMILAAMRFLTRLSECLPLHIAAPHLAECQLLFIIMFTLSFLELRGKWTVSYSQGSFKVGKPKMTQEEYPSIWYANISPLKNYQLCCSYETDPPSFTHCIISLAPVGMWVCCDSCNKIIVEMQPNTWEFTKVVW